MGRSRRILCILCAAFTSAASAAVVPPFASDGCVPGYTATGEFVDAQGKVLDGKDWVATADKKVVTKSGKPVLLDKNCLSQLASTDATMLGILAGVIIVGLAAGGTSSTSGTN